MASLSSVEHKSLKDSFGQEVLIGVKKGVKTKKLLGNQSRMNRDGEGVGCVWVRAGYFLAVLC